MSLAEKKIVESVLKLVSSLLEDNDETRGCCGSGVVNKVTIEYNFSFKIIDNETGGEI